MAWSSAALSSDYQSRMDAGTPLWLPRNVLGDADSVDWGSTVAAAKNNDSDYPASNVISGYTNKKTQPGAAGTTNINFLIDAHTNPITFDTIAIIIDPSTLGGTAEDATFYIEIADDNAFSSNNEIITANADNIVATGFTPELSDEGFAGLNSKLYCYATFDLRTWGDSQTAPRKYSNVPYIRIVINPGTNLTPIIYSVWFGERFQTPSFPLIGYDRLAQENGLDIFTSDNGVSTTYKRHSGKRILDASHSFDEDEYTDEWNKQLRLLQYYTDYGRKPFLYFEPFPAGNISTPYIQHDGTASGWENGDPVGIVMAYWMILQSSNSFVNTNANIYETSIKAVEAGGSLMADREPYFYMMGLT